MSKRSYSGPALDWTMTPITERPELEDEAEDVVYATEAEEEGTESVENVPMPGEDDEDEPVRIPGQSTLTEFSRRRADE